MPRRGENIYRRQDGRWEGRYIADRKPDGKAVYRSIYGTSYAQVRERLIVKRQETHKQQIGACTLTEIQVFGECRNESPGHETEASGSF